MLSRLQWTARTLKISYLHLNSGTRATNQKQTHGPLVEMLGMLISQVTEIKEVNITGLIDFQI